MDDFSPRFEPLAIEVMALETSPMISFEVDSDTFAVDPIKTRLNQQLGKNDLGVSLLVERLEQAYQELVMDDQLNSTSFIGLRRAEEAKCWGMGFRHQKQTGETLQLPQDTVNTGR